MTFEEYLLTKKIDQKTFHQAEPKLYESWKIEFEQIHPSSFTAQKLYLINPLRRKYILKIEPTKITEQKTIPAKVREEPNVADHTTANVEPTQENSDMKPANQSPKPARPVFKPKPKID